ncbi:peptide MFS transporter [Porphyromonas endodontalis]|uniref:Amino acid/peptide transporter n=1 Tax=Porphyromonas endodontalis (strain ATCC 35406 / DSM 24491 / JCM 8526 / CCUG 16442 / BCRC 14492 / NCTC 13058 / HG 370) TaxID=553175 RepID=C3J9N0_POREA|nr:peptide MFS transporter [Porphyromonas endodontalis]EEN83056.1 amino acid/peptide transporter [Porphyromonas endodontalis ATCC 35406]UBH64992.1 peptide MFS transporter [Porphyromonas endodontalis]SUB68410.1 Dipeptide and tripeptide permease B [Porphyromonas endodontalis]
MFKNHPKGLVAAALSNMGERFGYYIMNAVLLLFLCSKFGLDDTTSGVIYSVFYALIYILSLVGGVVADRSQNYKATIISGLAVMTLGYVLISIPIMSTSDNISWLLPFTCFALLLIAFGNGLFKGNLQAIVGQMYDDLETEAAKEGEEALRLAKGKRDSGFQIFYVFINIGGLIAPFVAPLLRSWWLGVHNLTYNASLPELCHKFINNGGNLVGQDLDNITKLVSEVGGSEVTLEFCQRYLDIFNAGVHYSFIASVVAMLISMVIFVVTKKKLPNPAKKEAHKAVDYTPEEKAAMASEIKRRLYALFAVLGVAIFFWFSFHQNGQSLSVFARDFIVTSSIPPEIWQAVNPFFVIVLTPIIMAIFGALARRGRSISTPRKIAIGMAIAAIAYVFLAILSMINGFPSGDEFRAMDQTAQNAMKSGAWVLIVTYFFLTVAELFISPLGLSFVSKVAPKHLQGLCQGLWLGATAIGNLLIWIGPLMYNKIPLWQCWTVFAIVCIISMGIMLAMVKWLERVAH